MADHENCVPVSIGFSETALIPSRIECRARQVCVHEREHPTSTRGISVAGAEPGFLAKNQLPSQAPEWISCQTVKALPTGLEKSPGGGVGASTDVCSLESQHQGYHEKSHKSMDRGDCQGNIHSSWSRLWPSYCTWGQSPVCIMGLQLSGGLTWHPVSSILEVIWGIPEFVLTRHGVYRWWHVYTGSSGGSTTHHGSRASSPTSIAYTICMQPLLQRS